MVPTQPLVWRSISSQVMGWLCASMKIEAWDAHVVDHAVVHVADEVLVVGNAGNGGEECLGDGVRHVDSARVAPFGDDVTVADDDAIGRRMRCQRTERIAIRPRELQRDGEALIALVDDALELGREPGFVRDGEVDRRLQSGRIEAFLLRRVRRPGIARRDIILRLRGGCGAHGKGREKPLSHPFPHANPLILLRYETGTN